MFFIKTEILFKNRNFGQKSKLVISNNNQKYGQKLRFLLNVVKNLGRELKFCQNSKFRPKN